MAINNPYFLREYGVSFLNLALLETALTHSSYLNEHADERLECNERLEFLGDAILGLAVAEELYRKSNDRGSASVFTRIATPIDVLRSYTLAPVHRRSVDLPDEQLHEGEMTLIRSQVVSGETLARVARNLGIGEHLLMGSGEEKSGGRNRKSNLAAAYEAIVGAIYLDKGYRGYDVARDFCIRTLKDEIDAAYDRVTSAPKQPAKSKSANKPDQSKKPKKPVTAGKHPKSALQEISQAEHGTPPVYEITKATGKSNAMTFTAQVAINGKTMGSGAGSSKKAAETAAAKAALAKMS